MNPNQALWEKGDFTRIAASMRDERRGARRSDRDHRGTRGARSRLRRRHHRAPRGTPRRQGARRRHRPQPRRGRATSAPPRAASTTSDSSRATRPTLTDLADDQFDLVVSIFGAMFAPRPFDVAKEMVRVTRPGGRIVMGNWIPGDPTLVAQILKISSAYSPPPPEGFVSPMTWGVVDDVVERFTAAGIPEDNIVCEPDTFVFEAPVSPTEFLDVVPRLLRPDDERVRRRRLRTAAPTSSSPSSTRCSTRRTRADRPTRPRSPRRSSASP